MRTVVPGGYGGIPLEAALASDIAAVTCDMLDANPYAYVTNYDEVKAWVDHEKEIEMSSLLPTKRRSKVRVFK